MKKKLGQSCHTVGAEVEGKNLNAIKSWTRKEEDRYFFYAEL